MFSLRRATRLAPSRAVYRQFAVAQHPRFSSSDVASNSNDTASTSNGSETTSTSTVASTESSNGNGPVASSNGTSAKNNVSTGFKPVKTSSKPVPPKQVHKPSTPEPVVVKNTSSLAHWNAKTISTAGPPRPPRSDQDVDWENSYQGVATRPVTEAQFKVLMQPLAEADIEVKPDGVIYLPEIKYRRKLNEAFGPMGWGLIPRSEPTLANGVATREYALIIDGRFVSQAQGENTYFSPEGMPSAVEGCKSNALMRCCKDLGIASELWDPVFIRNFKKRYMQEVWVEHAVSKKKRTFWYKQGQVNVVYPWKKTS